jgi:hypothetical protein
LEEGEQDDVDMNDAPDMSNGVSKAMLEEEKLLEEAAIEKRAAKEAAFQAEREKDIQGGEAVVGSKFKKLEYLLNQSKVGGQFSTDMELELIHCSHLDLLVHIDGQNAAAAGRSKGCRPTIGA